MLNKLGEIETEAVEKLVKLKKERDRIRGFNAKAEEMRSSVASGIFTRVVDDYQEREQALDAEAVPLRAEAREQYATLRRIFDEINAALEKARAEREELEFRHAVGELPKKQLADALGESADALETREKELAEADKLKEKFLAAFDSEDDLEGVDVGAPAADDEADVYATVLAPRPADPTTLGGESPDKTVMFDKALGDGDGDDEGDGDGDDEVSGGTVLVPRGRLIRIDNGESSTEYRLGAINYVGRSPDNHVCIEAPNISRRHALLAADVDGFTLKDLDTPNGTFVNEDRISKITLSDGDRIKIGNVELLFRSQ